MSGGDGLAARTARFRDFGSQNLLVHPVSMKSVSQVEVMQKQHTYQSHVFRTLLSIAVLWGTSSIWASESQERPSSDNSSVNTSRFKLEIQKGVLLLDGRYIPTPYTLELDENSIRINGEPIQRSDFDLSNYKNWERPRPERNEDFPRGSRSFASMRVDPFGAGNRRGSFGRRGPGSQRNPGGPRGGGPPGEGIDDRIWQDLSAGSIDGTVILEREKPLVTIMPSLGGDDAFEHLVSHRTDSDLSMALPPKLKNRISDESWQTLISGFQSNPLMREAVEKRVDRLKRSEEAAELHISANTWVHRLSFPLTVFGYIMVVVAVGHLMQNTPKNTGSIDSLSLERARKISIQTLTIVAILSAVDLIWTLVAHHAGSMRELNPLGSGVIDHPVLLVLFKTTVTAISIGLLYRLHHSSLARQATWWCCLVLTLLTARWLTFQSMFV